MRNRALLRTFYRAGLRCAEALALKSRDVQLGRNEIRVNAGKGDKDRVVWIDSTTVEILERWKLIRPRSEFFFCTLKGSAIDDSYVRAMMARYGVRAGIKIRTHPHILRHTFATELLEDGYNVHEVKTLLGHEDLATTELYLHVANEGLRRRLLERG